jgi:hypothetical protein
MPSIKEKLEKSKYLLPYLRNVWFFASVGLVLSTLLLLGSVRLSTLFKDQGMFSVRVAEASFSTNLSGKMGAYVGSKTGKSYYFPWCGVANRIKDANLVWFTNRTEAEAKGYKLASNCHGLK